jgi:hypothetical protein
MIKYLLDTNIYFGLHLNNSESQLGSLTPVSLAVAIKAPYDAQN